MDKRTKKTILDYWKKNGVDTTNSFFRLFGLDMGRDGPDGKYYSKPNVIHELIFDFYGGYEKILKNLNYLVGKEHTIEDGGYNYDVRITEFYYDYSVKEIHGYPVWPMCKVIADGQGEVFLFNLDETMNISKAVNDEDFGWEIKSEMRDSVRDWLFEKVTKKTGVIIIVEEIDVHYEF